MPGSIEFLQEQFGVNGILSAHKPELVTLPEQYDLVFVLSMFTHLPPAMWKPWLHALGSAVAPGGVLVFSVANETSARELGVSFSANGTHFIASSESPSIDAEIYGTTYTTSRFVSGQVEAALGRLPSHCFSRAFWGGQDAVVVRF